MATELHGRHGARPGCGKRAGCPKTLVKPPVFAYERPEALRPQ